MQIKETAQVVAESSPVWLYWFSAQERIVRYGSLQRPLLTAIENGLMCGLDDFRKQTLLTC